MISSTIISVDKQVLGFCLDIDFFAKVKNKIDRDMFDRELKDIFDTIVYSHTKYAKTLTKSELSGIFNDRNPAIPDSARFRVQDVISELDDKPTDNNELHLDLVNNLWLRDRARQIGEKALEIFTGENEEFGELRRLIDAVEDGRMSDKTTYTIVDKDLSQLLEEEAGVSDFPFHFHLIHENLKGMDRGNLGIIFARPEVGKTTFCCFLASSYIKQKFKVTYWANEEPAGKIKLRIIQSYFELTREEMVLQKVDLLERYRVEIEPYLTIMDSVGTSIEEVDEYAKLNKPDIMFCDQLDKFRISGQYNRGDERLKETYVTAREIAKRNQLLMWAVSQASYDAHDRQFIDYSMLDNSRTGKAGEADVIIGIGKTGSSEVENTMRHICISKNKNNGWHGMINAQIDVHRGVYY
jgi:replicative DNA helicase|tara:strand:- start:1331 stop:2560 length:1230 start_codon:yes stop_codon:yes gene_type:complete